MHIKEQSLSAPCVELDSGMLKGFNAIAGTLVSLPGIELERLSIEDLFPDQKNTEICWKQLVRHNIRVKHLAQLEGRPL